MAKKKAVAGSITMRLVRGRDVGACVRQRLRCGDDDIIECYTYHRP